MSRSFRLFARATFAASVAALPLACTSAPPTPAGEVEPTVVTEALGGNCVAPMVPFCRINQRPMCKCGICPRGTHGECNEEILWCGCMPDVAPSNPTQIAAGRFMTYARKDDGSVWGWGLGTDGALGGAASSSAPIAIAGVSSAQEVTAGDAGGCARLADGRVKCWGLAQTTPDTKVWSPRFVTSADGAALTGAVGIAQGTTHACAWGGGVVQCWGDGTKGQLGDGAGQSRESAAPVPAITDAASVALGGETTCVLSTSGVVRCFGDNGFGQCGIGSRAFVNVPTRVVGIDGVTKLYGGGYGTFCAEANLPAPGTYCWGVNTRGQVGRGDVASVLSPASTKYAVGPKRALGRQVTCNTWSASSSGCWGNNENGELMALSPSRSLDPLPLWFGGSTPDQIAIGEAHLCALLGTRVVCWGDDTYGQLGNGASPEPGPHRDPVDVAF
jgi:alpha-tubulin suppressor-like RCC1 family protein